MIQLREKAPRCAEELVALAEPFRRAADAHGALFILNDRPDLVADCGADGVHVGQDDMPVAEARDGRRARTRSSGSRPTRRSRSMPPSPRTAPIAPTRSASAPSGRRRRRRAAPATGLGLIEHAARAAGDLPWFAIGGIDTGNVGEVVAAGAARAVVVRAIRDAADPEVSRAAAARGARWL